jgi:alanyl-tRNA synthetase
LNGLPVVDVIDEDDGRVAHVVAGHLSLGDAVVGEIDWSRRFDHMQQHSGQHILSAAFERLHQVRTESFRLGADFSTIDRAREVAPAEIAAAEDDANRLVWAGRPVSIRFVSAEEAGRLPLRKGPARSGRLRLIEIEGYDLSACGGTHVSSTGEIGVIAVRGWERFRGGTRIEFVCGGRALVACRSWRDVATAAARLLSSTPAELSVAIERLQDEAREARRTAKLLAEKAASLESLALASRATDVEGVSLIVECMEDYDLAALKLLAGSFVQESSRAIVLVTAVPPLQVVALRSPDVSAVNCATLVGILTREFGGRGGGKPENAQGGGLGAAPAALVEAARRAIVIMLGQRKPKSGR